MSRIDKRQPPISESADDSHLTRRKKLEPGHFCVLNDGLDLNRDECDQDYVGTVEPLLQKPVQNTETEVSSPVLVQATEAPALEPNALDPDSSIGFLPTPPPPILAKDDAVVELDSEQTVGPTLWICFSREITPGQRYSDGRRVLEDCVLRCQAKGCTHKGTLSILGSSRGNLFRDLRNTHGI
jgi:hypothetical protein